MKSTTKSQSTSRRIATACLASCRKLLAQMEDIRQTILLEFREATDPRLLQLALNEAEALARQTPYPHLFFPELALEKAQSVRDWQARQQSLRSEHSLPREDDRLVRSF